MPQNRSYRLLCPIARDLDREGDRWALQINRDLHASPARFTDIQTGLTGLASNLLTSRLQQLQRDGLVTRRQAEHGVVLYELTPEGERTAPLLFELSAFGSGYPAPDDVRSPGNLRTVAVTLKEALRRVVQDETLHVELVVDDERFGVRVEDGGVAVRYGASPEADVSVGTQYLALIAVTDGDLSLEDFSRDHVSVIRGQEADARAFLDIMGRAFSSETVL